MSAKAVEYSGDRYLLGSLVAGESIEIPLEWLGLSSGEARPPSKPLYIKKIDYETKTITLDSTPVSTRNTEYNSGGRGKDQHLVFRDGDWVDANKWTPSL